MNILCAQRICIQRCFCVFCIVRNLHCCCQAPAFSTCYWTCFFLFEIYACAISPNMIFTAATSWPISRPLSRSWLWHLRRRRARGRDTQGPELPGDLTMGDVCNLQTNQRSLGPCSSKLFFLKLVTLSAFSSTSQLRFCFLPSRLDRCYASVPLLIASKVSTVSTADSKRR